MASQNTLFRQQQQLYRSSHYFGKPRSPPLYVEQADSYNANDQQGKGRKRRASEDESMEDLSDGGGVSFDFSPSLERTNTATTTTDKNVLRPKHDKITKRKRIGAEKQFPLDKLLATLDKERLIDLISNLVDAHPRLHPEVEEAAAVPHSLG
ncbi:hypothetical protein K492DRAFT_163786 [Lichtheimia hyalospora FSU 10163]|nr:hypothetical protein K492DRAFT_163786 [Lichtheimia hyalospora FSU 10163]